uniref:Uncharacterized protein n=1 Tax=Clostridium botulinum TaxID=1491 RepID=A0A126JI66_CLOBO|nr:hypothetical protein [Clostridium botulinum]
MALKTDSLVLISSVLHKLVTFLPVLHFFYMSITINMYFLINIQYIVFY